MLKVVKMESALKEGVKSNLISLVNRMKIQLSQSTDNEWDSNFWKFHGREVRFTKLSSENRRKSQKILDADFIDFAKSYITQEVMFSKRKISPCLLALRAIESILIKRYSYCDISKISMSVFDESLSLLEERYSLVYCYDIAAQMANLASFISENKITQSLNIHSWKNPLKVKCEDFIHNKAKNKGKLPNEVALNAFAEIFSQQLTNRRDIFTTSVIVLLMSAPSRISEILALPMDCLMEDITKKGEVKYGLRFWAGKGYGGEIKWISSVMVPIVEVAIERILSLTKEARTFAKLMELDFKGFHNRLDRLKKFPADRMLTSEQVIEILTNQKKTKKDCIGMLKRLSLIPTDGAYCLESLWIELRSRLPPNFPWYDKAKNIKYSNLLFLIFKDSFHPRRSDNIIQLYIPKRGFFIQDISPERENVNIFERYGYKNSDGSAIHFNTHQIRHLLNTIAQRNGLSEFEIAKWSGRVNVSQNRVYNHVDEEEILEKYESLKALAKSYEASSKISKFPLTSSENKAGATSLYTQTLHITEFGYCTHDFVVSPCEKFRDCVNCSDQVCIKGHTENLTRLKEKLSHVKGLIDKVAGENSSGSHGDIDEKDQWLTFQVQTKERLTELIRILEDMNTPDGSFIRLSNKSFTHLSRLTNEENLLNHKVRSENVKKIN
ncbi:MULTISPECIES: hypothetical protein [Klebsiella]|nr:hypothetical protein [Klebsiella variicola]EBP5991352.1 hypothetical protein [Salmonella enterica]EFW5577252.1 hypothetical protein [Salmonella enterica]ELL1481452.1 hypothetical protein [Salmonella enterica]GKK58413.1 DNA-binding protein [Klebsiella variicola]HCI9337879.1 hypothetical protein [Klebsiella variicola]